ncbi:hypothetical protein EVAR_14087_1 [Eumeta japonica]|uniref:Uncharacterized protein n=1 Tax=Eumeta variegata TaxID=151549 RepID=A0A4C1UN72_EUMVA|nr:hypothetical protein EVAR_14087_1 [Eumeta japonica]
MRAGPPPPRPAHAPRPDYLTIKMSRRGLVFVNLHLNRCKVSPCRGRAPVSVTAGSRSAAARRTDEWNDSDASMGLKDVRARLHLTVLICASEGK